MTWRRARRRYSGTTSGAAVDNYARYLAAGFVLACMAVGAVLGALYSLVAAVIGGWRG